MAIRDRVLEYLGGVSRTTLASEVALAGKRAYEAGYNERAEDEPPSGGIVRYGYRTLTSGERQADFDIGVVMEAVWKIFQSNPIAVRALEIKRDYIIGGGLNCQVQDERLQEIIDRFIKRNSLNRRASEFTTQLFLFGMQCIPAFVRESDGAVSLGYIDPAEIEDVITHPENVLEICAVVVKPRLTRRPWETSSAKRVYRVIRENQDGELLTHKQAVKEKWEAELLKYHGLEEYSGDVFYERVNAVSNVPFGFSDLLQVADWLDQHDETLFALADREQMAGYFSWDVAVDGTPEQVAERESAIRKKPPKKGSVNVHNLAEAWTFNFPDIKQPGTIETANALLTFVLGGLGLPRHWYGHGDETNRATAQAQGDPTWRSLQHDQGVVYDFLMSMLAFQRDQAKLAGYLPDSDDDDITLVMPEMTSKDMATLTTMLSSLATALMIAEQQQWITHEQAVEVWAKALAEIDVDIDVQEVTNAYQQAQAATPDMSGAMDAFNKYVEGAIHADA